MLTWEAVQLGAGAIVGRETHLALEAAHATHGETLGCAFDGRYQSWCHTTVGQAICCSRRSECLICLQEKRPNYNSPMRRHSVQQSPLNASSEATVS